jgi:RimJ/RimL family protein N-acetyltransferase
LGVRPDLTGQGRGSTYTTAVCNFAVQTFAPTKLRVTIAEFNQRAQHAWAKAGFVQSYAFRSAHGARPFVVLTRAAITPPA